MQNFQAAGEILASVWSETVIDGHPVVAEFCPAGKENEFERVEQEWIDRLFRQSKYLLPVVNCKQRSCCSAPRTAYEKMIFGSRFLPPPIPLETTQSGPAVGRDGSFGNLFQNLWLSKATQTEVIDKFCPKINVVKHKCGLTELDRRTCKCRIYDRTLAALKDHKSVCRGPDIGVPGESEMRTIS